MSKQDQQLQRLTENATLLAAIKPIVVQPLLTKILEESSPNGGLSSDRERLLADDFAFVSACNDNIKKVAAACIEQSGSRAGMTIRIAVNTGAPAGLEDNLVTLATLLEKARARREYLVITCV